MKRHCIFIICAVLLFSLTAFPVYAHSGKTDASGGHNSPSGYHYHCGGYPAHQHPNGVCPYEGSTADSKNSSSSSGATSSSADTRYSSTKGSSGYSFTSSSLSSGDIGLILLAVVVITVVIIIDVSLISSLKAKKAKSNNATESYCATPEQHELPPPPPPVLSPPVPSSPPVVTDKNNPQKKNAPAQSTPVIFYNPPAIPPIQVKSTPVDPPPIETNVSLNTQNQSNGNANNDLDNLSKKEKAELNELRESVPHLIGENFILSSENEKLRKQIETLHEQLNFESDRWLVEQLERSNNTSKLEIAKLQETILNLQLNLDTLYNHQNDLIDPDSLIKILSAQEHIYFSNQYPIDSFLNSIYIGRYINALQSDMFIEDQINVTATIHSKEHCYTTTLSSCTCEDFTYRKIPCKHMIYLAQTIGTLYINSKETSKKIDKKLNELNKLITKTKKKK